MQPLVKMCSKGLLACSYKDIEDESKKSARERVRAVQWDSGIAFESKRKKWTFTALLAGFSR